MMFYFIWACLGILAGFYTYGTTVAEFSHDFPGADMREHRATGVLFGSIVVMLPPTVIAVICLSQFNKHGFKL